MRGSTRLAIGAPDSLRGTKLKSVSWLLSRKPPRETEPAVDHEARPPGGLDAAGHGQGAALAVYDADVAGPVLRLLRHGRAALLHAGRYTRRGLGHALATRAGGDELGPPGEVVVVEQAHPGGAGRRHVVRIGHVKRTVREGQACRFGIEMQPVRPGTRALWAALRAQLGGGGMGQQAQDLSHGQGARARWRHAADAHVMGAARLARHRRGAVDETQGRAHLDFVFRQVIGTQFARMAWMRAHLAHDGFGHLPAVEGVAALCGDASQHGGELGISEHMAHGPGAALGIVVMRSSHRVTLQLGCVAQQGMQPWTHGKALFGQGDGRLEQAAPGQLAMLAVGQLQQAQHAGGAD